MSHQVCPMSTIADLDGVIEGISGDQSKYINSLELRLKSADADVKSKDAEISVLQAKLAKTVRQLPTLLTLGHGL